MRGLQAGRDMGARALLSQDPVSSVGTNHLVRLVISEKLYFIFVVWRNYRGEYFYIYINMIFLFDTKIVKIATFFVLMTTIWWPHGMLKVIKFQKYCLFWASWQKNLSFDKYIVRKKKTRGRGCHDQINMNNGHRLSLDHIS